MCQLPISIVRLSKRQLTQTLDQLPVVLQESSVVASFRYSLRTPANCQLLRTHHPVVADKLMSTASQRCSTFLAALSSTSGSLPQNC